MPDVDWDEASRQAQEAIKQHNIEADAAAEKMTQDAIARHDWQQAALKLDKIIAAPGGIGTKGLVQTALPPYFKTTWTGPGAVYNLEFPVVSEDFPRWRLGIYNPVTGDEYTLTPETVTSAHDEHLTGFATCLAIVAESNGRHIS